MSRLSSQEQTNTVPDNSAVNNDAVTANSGQRKSIQINKMTHFQDKKNDKNKGVTMITSVFPLLNALIRQNQGLTNTGSTEESGGILGKITAGIQSVTETINDIVKFLLTLTILLFLFCRKINRRIMDSGRSNSALLMISQAPHL